MSNGPLLVTAFWMSVAGTLYAYGGFPFLIRLLASRRRVAAVDVDEASWRVPVTVIIPAYNEEKHLEAKLRNVLAADYPSELLEVFVVSDASTDRTNEIAEAFAPRGVHLVVQETRKGKTAGLNRAMALATGEIVVFTDANATYPPEVIGTLVHYLKDPRVGLVSGYTRYAASDNGDVAEVTNLYTRLEREIKAAESRWGCCVGADGAIFAMRRSLYRDLRDDDINDFVLPLNVIDHGYWCVFAENAFCSENPGEDFESEFRRQSRITNRTLRALWRNRHLLNPMRFPVFSFFLFSHKVMRFIVPLLLATAAISLAALALTHVVYLAVAVAAASAVALALVSTLFPRVTSPGPLGFLSAFLTINIAMLNGWSKFVFGASDVTWQHNRVGGR